MDILAILRCFGACVAAIPWWVWLVVVLVGAIIGALTYLGGLVLGGAGVIVISALIKAMLWGALAGVLTTFGYCLLGCVGK